MKIVGTPWHISTGDRLCEEDSRHDKRLCFYYNKNDNICLYNMEKCIGSSHCEFYTEEKDVSFLENITNDLKILTGNYEFSNKIFIKHDTCNNEKVLNAINLFFYRSMNKQAETGYAYKYLRFTLAKELHLYITKDLLRKNTKLIGNEVYFNLDLLIKNLRKEKREDMRNKFINNFEPFVKLIKNKPMDIVLLKNNYLNLDRVETILNNHNTAFILSDINLTDEEISSIVNDIKDVINVENFSPESINNAFKRSISLDGDTAFFNATTFIFNLQKCKIDIGNRINMDGTLYSKKFLKWAKEYFFNRNKRKKKGLYFINCDNYYNILQELDKYVQCDLVNKVSCYEPLKTKLLKTFKNNEIKIDRKIIDYAINNSVENYEYETVLDIEKFINIILKIQ